MTLDAVSIHAMIHRRCDDPSCRVFLETMRYDYGAVRKRWCGRCGSEIALLHAHQRGYDRGNGRPFIAIVRGCSKKGFLTWLTHDVFTEWLTTYRERKE